MVNQMIPRHERVDARLWDAGLRRWAPLLPYGGLVLPYTTDLTINKGSITFPGDHPRAVDLAKVRAGIPLPVSFAINGERWSGQITSADYQSNEGNPVWVCELDSDHKHAHRMLSRSTAVSAADMTATRLQGWLGDVTRRLVASNAQRVGLPVYVLVEGEGDPVDLEARTEDSIYDVLQDAIAGSRMHLDMRMLLPEDDVPGDGVVEHYAGQMERAWEQHELDNGAWPHAQTHARIVGKAAPHPELMLPQHSWRGQGTIDVYGEPLLYPEAGICWAPFETLAEAPADYYTTINPEGIRVANEQELRILQDNQFMGWSQHVTMWENWQTAAQPETLSPNLLLDSGGITLGGSETGTYVTLDESAGDKTTINIAGAGSNHWNAYTFVHSRITDEGYFTTPGETFTLSVDVRADLPQDVTAHFSFDVRNPRHNSTAASFGDTGGQWVRISSTITIPSGDQRSRMLILFGRGSGNLDVGTIEVRRFKLERGAVATAWTRAPEEVELPGTDLAHLRGAVEAGLVATIDGTIFADLFDVDTYVDGDDVMFAWRDGPRWILANQQDFDVEHAKRQPRGPLQKQTPGLLFHLHGERDRRGVIFSTTPGGGLEAWSVKHIAPDAAMIVAGGQVDERTLAAIRDGATPPSALGVYTPEEAAGVLPSGSVVPGTIDRLDVDAQPLASIDGTEVSYSSAGGKVDLAVVGPFFYREKYLSLTSSGGGDPLHDITKSWTEAQGTTSMSLTPGHSTSVVFGDDVTRDDGTIIPGWRPGDRISFVDKWTRISEVVSGYRVEAENGKLISVVPILGRQERGVYADLANRLRDAERRATKAQLAPPRRLPEQELIAAAAAEATAVALVEEAARRAAIEEETAERLRMMEEEMEERARLEEQTREAHELALRALEEAFRQNAMQPVSMTWQVEDGDLPSTNWYLEQSYTVPEGESRRFEAEFSVTWGAASRGDWYEMSIDAAGKEVGYTGSNSIGPLSPLGNGVVGMSVTASFTAQPGDVIEFYLASSAGSGSRWVDGGQIRLVGA